MKYLIISLLFISSYADAIITIQEKNGTIVSQKRIISKKIVEKEKPKQENQDPYAEEMKKFNENVFGKIKENHKKVFGTTDEQYEKVEKWLEKFKIE